MPEPTVALATSAAVGAITDDDLLLARELHARGYNVQAAVWNDPDVSWSSFHAVVLRSTWDYHLHADAFRAFTRQLEQLQVPLWNPAPLVRWNSDKSYLRDLAAHGVRTAPTRWVGQHEHASLADIVNEEQWEQFVVKPSVSASAYRTWRGSLSEAALLETNFRGMITHGGVLVQPFIEAIVDIGELSLLFYGGVFSHAVLKRPRADDFRVQREHGGSSEPIDAPQAAIDAATAILAASERLHGASAYARVDGCIMDGEFVLMELELIEPDLYLRMHPDAPRRLADALAL
jgi:hypothetical protein